MEKYVTGENGLNYTLGEYGMYYPVFQMPESSDYEIGRYGRMRAEYVKKYRHEMYLELFSSGRWNAYLHEVDEECYEYLDMLIDGMKKEAGVTEDLKREDQMIWVGMMNNVRCATEEIVVKERVYVD